MYPTIKECHSIIAFIVLLSLLGAILYSAYCWTRKRAFAPQGKGLALSGLIAVHLQMAFGFITYLVSPLGVSNFSKAAMKSPVSRFYLIEHPLTMAVAVVLITIGYSKAKRKENDVQKNKTIAVFYAIGLILIASRIPWNTWL